MLIETLVETPRYTRAVYRASGWIRVGGHPGARTLRHEQPPSTVNRCTQRLALSLSQLISL